METVTLDAVLAERKFSRCRFCKIDVERTELEVLRGFDRTLQAHDVDYLLVELLAGAPAHHHLIARDYHGWLVSEQTPRLVPIADVPAGTFGDYVFVRPGLLGRFSGRPFSPSREPSGRVSGTARDRFQSDCSTPPGADQRTCAVGPGVAEGASPANRATRPPERWHQVSRPTTVPTNEQAWS